MTKVEWKAPGPGTWMADDSHYKGTMSGFLLSLMREEHGRAISHGFTRYGLPIGSVRMELVNGRMYFQPQMVGAPRPKEGKTASPPPKAILRLMVLLHPELRRRRRAARRAFATKLWRADRERWRTKEGPRLRARNVALGAARPDTFDDAALARHFDECLAQFHDGNFVHFDNNLASSFPVGDWASRTCAWTGCAPAEAIAVLQGSNAASASTLELLRPLADAVARSRDAVAIVRGSGDATTRLAALRRASPEIEAALDAYLDEFGNRVITGFDVTDRTLHEMPPVVLASVAAQLDAGGRPDVEARARAAAHALRDRVPVEARAEYDALLEEARAAYGLHDEDVGVAWLWPLGLLRRALLAIGDRLAVRGALKDAEHVFECTPDEVRALLAGASPAPGAIEVARRLEQRRALDDLEGPPTLGPEQAPPPPGLMPPEFERMMSGLMFYLANMSTEPPAASPGADAASLRGTAASGGRYEGRARVVSGPADFSRLVKGDVLVAPTTSPTYNVVLPLLGAVVTDRGGALSHAAIVAREFGIPAVVGTRDATRRIPDGARVVVDGTAGTVEIVS